MVIAAVYGVTSQSSHQSQPRLTVETPPTAVTVSTPTQPMPAPRSLNPVTKYGHFPYPELERNRLILIASYGEQENQRYVEMEREAGMALFQLIHAARNRGLWIIPISGFRTVDYQADLFNRQVQKQGSEIAAARISAPPGFSEHHTGLAIDLGDGFAASEGVPDITEAFGRTRAYAWLQKNAQTYGFELSYPPNNAQGVMYEPWHWRYVGSPWAQQVFAQARSGSRR